MCEKTVPSLAREEKLLFPNHFRPKFLVKQSQVYSKIGISLRLPRMFFSFQLFAPAIKFTNHQPAIPCENHLFVAANAAATHNKSNFTTLATGSGGWQIWWPPSLDIFKKVPWGNHRLASSEMPWCLRRWVDSCWMCVQCGSRFSPCKHITSPSPFK